MKLPIPKGRRAILVLGVPLGLAAAGGFLFMQMSAAPTVTAKVPDPAAGQVGPILPLESRVVNLTTTNAGAYKYALIAVSIELRPKAATFYDLHGEARTTQEETEIDECASDIPLLLDALGSTVSAHDSGSLTTPDGRAKLKEELLEAFRKVLGEEEVLHVYFTDFKMSN